MNSEMVHRPIWLKIIKIHIRKLLLCKYWFHFIKSYWDFLSILYMTVFAYLKQIWLSQFCLGTKQAIVVIVHRKCTFKVSMKVYKFVTSFNLIQTQSKGLNGSSLWELREWLINQFAHSFIFTYFKLIMCLLFKI